MHEPSSFEIGWSPPARSMIESRRAASPTGPSRCTPPLSGPRWTSVALIAASRSASAAPSRDAIPQIPHMGPNSMGRPGSRLQLARAARANAAAAGLRRRPAPEEARLPAGEARLVDELEVEERTHVRLAGGERDRLAEPLRLELRRERRDVLAAVVAVREARRHVRLETVLEIPDVERVAEPPAQDRGEPRVVALAEEAAVVHRVRGLGSGARVRVVPERVDERTRPPALRDTRRRPRSRNASGAWPEAVESRTVTPLAMEPVVAACEKRRVFLRRPAPVRRRVRLVPDDDRRSVRNTVRARGAHTRRTAAAPSACAAYACAKPKTARTTRVCCAACSARASSSSRAPAGAASPFHGTQTRTASAPSRLLPAHDAERDWTSTSACRRRLRREGAVHVALSGGAGARPRRRPPRRGGRCAISRRAIRGPAAIASARASRSRTRCAGRGAPSGRRSIRGRARASPPSTSRSRGAPARGR